MIGRRQFIASSLATVAAGRLVGSEADPASGPGGLVRSAGPYADFVLAEKWLEVEPEIAIDPARFGSDRPSLRLTSRNGSVARAEAALGAPPSRLLQLDVYVEQPSTCSRFDVSLSCNDFTGWINKTGLEVQFVAGWNRIQFSINDCVVQGASMSLDNWDKVSKVRFAFISKPGATATIWLSRFRWLRTKAALTFTWDDGRAGCHDLAMPIMRQYGWNSTLYVVTQAIDQRSYTCAGGGTLDDPLTLDQLHFMQDEGWDISSHTCSHPDLTKLSNAQKRYELEASKQWLDRNGFARGSRFFATPYGKRDTETQAIAASIYENLRDASASPANGYETPLNMNGALNTRYQLRFQEIQSEGRTPLRQFQSWVDTAIASGTWLIVVGHTVDNPAGWLDPDWLRRALMYLDARRDKVDVLTMSQYWDLRNRSLDEFNLPARRS